MQVNRCPPPLPKSPPHLCSEASKDRRPHKCHVHIYVMKTQETRPPAPRPSLKPSLPAQCKAEAETNPVVKRKKREEGSTLLPDRQPPLLELSPSCHKPPPQEPSGSQMHLPNVRSRTLTERDPSRESGMGGTDSHRPSLQTCSDLSAARLLLLPAPANHCSQLAQSPPYPPTPPTTTTSRAEKQSQGRCVLGGGRYLSQRRPVYPGGQLSQVGPPSESW